MIRIAQFFLISVLMVSCSTSSTNVEELNSLLRNKEYEKLKIKSLNGIESSNDPIYHRYLGFALSELHDYEACISSLNIYMDKDVADVLSLIKLGDCYYKSGKTDMAYKTFLMAKKKEPNAKNVNYNIGIVEFDKGDLESAIKSFSAELDNFQFSFDALAARADSYEMIGNYDNAIADSKLAMKIDSSNYDLIHTLGSSLIKQKELIEARKVFERGLGYFPDSDEFHVKLASIYGANSDFEKVIEECNKAITINKLNATAIYLKALGFVNTEKLDSACFYFEKAKLLNANYSSPDYLDCGN